MSGDEGQTLYDLFAEKWTNFVFWLPTVTSTISIPPEAHDPLVIWSLLADTFSKELALQILDASSFATLYHKSPDWLGSYIPPAYHAASYDITAQNLASDQPDQLISPEHEAKFVRYIHCFISILLEAYNNVVA